MHREPVGCIAELVLLAELAGCQLSGATQGRRFASRTVQVECGAAVSQSTSPSIPGVLLCAALQLLDARQTDGAYK
jgi:hypothetical protein